MFKKYMDLAKINKIIAKQRKLAQTEPMSGYSAIISSMLEHEAKGTFKSYPQHTRQIVNNFFVECVQKLKTSDAWISSCTNSNLDPQGANDLTVIYAAVLLQALHCGDISNEESIVYSGDIENGCKILVNLKLLPQRWLNNDIDVTRVI